MFGVLQKHHSEACGRRQCLVTVLVRSNIAKFGQNAGFSEKKYLLLINNYLYMETTAFFPLANENLFYQA